jgi:integrase
MCEKRRGYQPDLFRRGEPDETAGPNIRYSELYAYFRRTYAQSRYKPKTQKVHDTSAKHLLGFFGVLQLAAITPQLVETYIANRKMDGVGNRTINIELTCFKCHLRMAERWDWLARNPFRFVRLLNEGPFRARYCSREELGCLLQSSPPWLQEVVRFAVSTGMRRGEIASLRWEQVKLAEGLVVLEETKTGQTRGVPLNETAQHILRYRPKRIGCPYVFWNPETGKPWADITHVFGKACRRAGIVGLRFHDLRHTCASYMVQAGVELQVVKEILGHKDLRMTLRYAHLAPRAKLEAAKRLDAFLLDGVCKGALHAV